jgi:hypothetical protein
MFVLRMSQSPLQETLLWKVFFNFLPPQQKKAISSRLIICLGLIEAAPRRAWRQPDRGVKPKAGISLVFGQDIFLLK